MDLKKTQSFGDYESECDNVTLLMSTNEGMGGGGEHIINEGR